MGLAAPQVGVNVRVMVFNPTGRRGEEEVTLVNPRLVSEGKARELGQEGCLSFPQVFAPVEVRAKAGHFTAVSRFVAGQRGQGARAGKRVFDLFDQALLACPSLPQVLAPVEVRRALGGCTC